MEVIEKQQTKTPQHQGEDLLYVRDLVFLRRGVKTGSEKAREVAAQTLSDVKRAMKIDYFDDMDLIRSQAKKYQG